MMRANNALNQAANDTLDDNPEKGKMAMQDWARGFSHACDQFRASWPTKATNPDDRAMIGRVADAISTGFTETELNTLTRWMVARHARNV